MSRPMFSPDSDDILLAISIINGGASILPEDLDAAVSHSISNLGPDPIRICANTVAEFKRGFLIGWAEKIRNDEKVISFRSVADIGVHAEAICFGKNMNFREGFIKGYEQCMIRQQLTGD